MNGISRVKKRSENNRGTRGSEDERGFTLLETIIALAIMTVALASILSVESNAIGATARARQMNIIAMLARNKMIETELSIEGKAFEEVKKEDGGEYPEPYKGFGWKSEIKEITFPNLNFSGSTPDQGGQGSNNAGNQQMDQYMKLLTNFLSKAIREVTVTISYTQGTSVQRYSVATYWVDLNHEFNLTEQ